MAGIKKLHIMEHTELIKVSDDKYKYVNTQFNKVQAKMYDYNCDIKLKVSKDLFRAHRDVLAEASDYFSAMFSHNMKEKEQEAIELHEISPQGFTSMLEYFYHGHVTVMTDCIEDIIEAARFFMIEWLLKVCCDFLIRHLSLENFDHVLTLADKYVLGDLRFDIFKFIGDNFAMLAQQPKFMQLAHDLFFLLLAEDYYIEATENTIFQTLMKWLHHDWEERKQYLVGMTEMIRFPLFEAEELEKIPAEVMEVPDLREHVEEARVYHAEAYRQCLMTSERTDARGSQNVVMAISAIEDANLIQYKVPRLPGYFSEKVSTDFLESVFEFTSLATLGNFVFIGGGYNRHTWCSSSDMYRYDPRNRIWMQLTSMSDSRVSFSMCASEKGIYAVAGIDHIVEKGRDSENILKSVEFYNAETGFWSFLPELPRGCFSIASAFSRGTLFVSGGINDDPEDNVPVNYLRTYIPGQDAWVMMAPMLTERQGHSMTALNDKLYVMGGYDSGADTVSFDHCLKVEVYDLELNQWTSLRNISPEVGHLHSSTCVFGDKIYVIGGKQASRFLSIFDPETNQLGDGEYCGEHVLKLASIKIPVPMGMDSEEEVEEEEEETAGDGGNTSVQ